MDDLTIRVQNTCLQPLTDQVEQGPVVDTQAQHVQQPRMVHMLEEALAISLYQVAIPSVLEVKGEGADRIQRPPSGAIAVTTLQKRLLLRLLSTAAHRLVAPACLPGREFLRAFPCRWPSECHSVGP